LRSSAVSLNARFPQDVLRGASIYKNGLLNILTFGLSRKEMYRSSRLPLVCLTNVLRTAEV